MKYIHSFLSILHHQLKVNRDFNVNFNLNMKYSSVRGKQKTLNFNIPTPQVTYCFSSLPSTHSTLASCSPSPPLHFSSSSLLLEILKNWKEEGDNMHIDSEQKLRHSYNQFGLRVVSKKLQDNITY